MHTPTVPVPDLVGLPVRLADKCALTSGVVLTADPAGTPLSPGAVITAQRPGPGTRIPLGEPVYVQIPTPGSHDTPLLAPGAYPDPDTGQTRGRARVVVAMALAGRYGSTRVEPVTLFDVTDRSSPGPPLDAVDVQFRAPLSFSLYLDRLLRSGADEDARIAFAVYQRVIAHTVERVQFSAGYVTDDGITSWPARLELAALGEHRVPGIPTVRMHHHVWIGRTAQALDDGARRPVDPDRLRHARANTIYGSYLSRLWELSTRECGVTWRSPRPGAVKEITDPPVHQQLAGHELGICPSPWGPRETWEQPTPAELAFEAEQERVAARNVARGRSRWTPPDQPLVNYLSEPDSW